jgi:FkbM family methyltransferase
VHLVNVDVINGSSGYERKSLNRIYNSDGASPQTKGHRMPLGRYFPAPVRKPVRIVKGAMKRFSQEQGLRGKHLLEYLRGREVWERPQVRCRKMLLGSGDGVWCVCPDLIKPDSVVYSIGVGTDISFDKALSEEFGVEVHGFDPTPVCREWIATQENLPWFHFHPYGLADYDGVAEFALPVTFKVSFTMLTDVPSSTGARGEVCRLSTILERLGHDRVHLLKLDIEGAEYAVIPEIARLAPRIDQLLIEFHTRFFEGTTGAHRTRAALDALKNAGFGLFNVSPRGLEYSFVRVDRQAARRAILAE